MNEELIMNNVLTLAKGISEILFHASIESGNEKIKKCMKESLLEYINIQGSIYDFMVKNGWYKNENVPESKIIKALNTFSKNED